MLRSPASEPISGHGPATGALPKVAEALTWPQHYGLIVVKSMARAVIDLDKSDAVSTPTDAVLKEFTKDMYRIIRRDFSTIPPERDSAELQDGRKIQRAGHEYAWPLLMKALVERTQPTIDGKTGYPAALMAMDRVFGYIQYGAPQKFNAEQIEFAGAMRAELKVSKDTWTTRNQRREPEAVRQLGLFD